MSNTFVHPPTPHPPFADDLIVSCDISADEELFMGQGDYQFDIYRIMREKNGSVLECWMVEVLRSRDITGYE